MNQPLGHGASAVEAVAHLNRIVAHYVADARQADRATLRMRADTHLALSEQQEDAGDFDAANFHAALAELYNGHFVVDVGAELLGLDPVEATRMVQMAALESSYDPPVCDTDPDADASSPLLGPSSDPPVEGLPDGLLPGLFDPARSAPSSACRLPSFLARIAHFLGGLRG